jgi:hypothetical protein
VQADPKTKVPPCGTFAEPSWTRTADPLLTMERLRQLVATHGNDFGLFRAFLGEQHLPLIATGCNHGAP